MTLRKRVEMLEESQARMRKCFYWKYFLGEPLLSVIPETASTQKAADITLEELARYVLDGKPIVRDAKQIVYGEERKSEEV